MIIINKVTLHEREIRLSSPLNLSAQSTNQEHLHQNTDNTQKIQAPSPVDPEPGLLKKWYDQLKMKLMVVNILTFTDFYAHVTKNDESETKYDFCECRAWASRTWDSQPKLRSDNNLAENLHDSSTIEKSDLLT